MGHLQPIIDLAEINGYVGAGGSWKSISKRYIGASGVWQPQQFKWVGKNGYWKLVYYDTPPDTTAAFWVWSLDGWTANPGNMVQIFGENLTDIQYPFPKFGAFYELDNRLTDRFDNYHASLGVGGVGFQTIANELALYVADTTQYATTFSSENSGVTALGLLGVNGNKDYGISVWIYLASSDFPAGSDKKWLWYAGVRTAFTGLYVTSDGLLHWAQSYNDITTEAVSSVALTSDSWNKVIVNRSGSDYTQCKLYLNGSVVATMPAAIAPIAPTNEPFYIGAGKDYAVSGTTDPQFSAARTIPAFTLSNGNRTVTKTGTTNNYGTARTGSTIVPGSGKYYFEMVWTDNPNANAVVWVGLGEPTYAPDEAIGISGYSVSSISRKFNHQTGGGTNYAGGSFVVGDVIGVLVDMTVGSMTVYKNGALVGTPFAAGAITTTVEALVAVDKAATMQCNFLKTDWQYAQAADVQAFPPIITYATTPTITVSSGMYVKNAYFCPAYIANDNIATLTAKPKLDIILKNKADSTETAIPTVWRLQTSNTVCSFTVPPDTTLGEYELFMKNVALGQESIHLPFSIQAFAKTTSGFVEDFSDPVSFHQRWYFLEHSWGGANGGVTGQNARIENGELVLQANGDLYNGSVQGVDTVGNPKTHTDPRDPLYGQPWTTRVGCCIVSQQNYGYGSYKIRCTIPPQTGVASAFWTFHYEEIYPTDPRYADFQSEGLHQQGNVADGYYLVRNHEIDIELPSNLDGQPTNQVSLQHAKFNTWRGELQNWDVASTDPSYWEEYNAALTDHGIDVGDGGFHEFRFDWHNDRVEYYIDGVLKKMQTNTSKGDVIPDIPGKLTLGLWFPSSAANSAGCPTWADDTPWLPNPERAWAGAGANWTTQEMRIQRIEFTPFSEPGERLIGETYAFGGLRATDGA